MVRNRTIPADFWTWEAVVDCAPMTRLLFVGLWTFADDHGVQPLRPRTMRRYPGISEAHQGLTPNAPPADTIETHSSPPDARSPSFETEADGHPEGSANHRNPPATPRQYQPHPEERPFGRVSKGGQHTPSPLPMVRDGRVAASSA